MNDSRQSTPDDLTHYMQAVSRYREALKEILSPPDASKGEYYGCLDLHEARAIAREALERDV